MSVKIDLITGFLGSGKTTFIHNYASYLISQGERIGILENDYGAVNVDLMLLNDLRGPSCELEMIAGGCDYDCHIRRFKTKLIAMAMSGYTRVIVEPSGIFDTDEFFDIIHDEPLDNWYEMGSVITLVNANLKLEDSSSRYLFASQLSTSGIVLFSRGEGHTKDELVELLNQSMKEIGCIREFKEDVLLTEYSEFSDVEFERIKNCGYHSYSFEKRMVMENNSYSSMYFMNLSYSIADIKKIAEKLFSTEDYGHILRVKGFVYEKDTWYEINFTKEEFSTKKIGIGQNVILVIGDGMNEALVSSLFE